jgi:predicted transcriptional regulator of viral defense system
MKYTTPKGPREERLLLSKLARAARGGLLTVSSAAATLKLPTRKAALKLASLARRGWLKRVRRGLYLVLPLEAEPGKPTVPEDAWILAREAFSPCYIGGWSAAEHWGLTEQLFRSTLVVTAANIRQRSTVLLGHEFRLFRVPRARVSGATPVWRGAERVSVSDRERTLLDCLQYPELCGGIRHLADIMAEYGRSKEKNVPKLITLAGQIANGAAWKRLGYLAETLWPEQSDITVEARKHVTRGYVRLDPAVQRKGRVVRRWNLRLNVPISPELNHA